MEYLTTPNVLYVRFDRAPLGSHLQPTKIRLLDWRRALAF